MDAVINFLNNNLGRSVRGKVIDSGNVWDEVEQAAHLAWTGNFHLDVVLDRHFDRGLCTDAVSEYSLREKTVSVDAQMLFVARMLGKLVLSTIGQAKKEFARSWS